jgi:hypothetical protein
LLGKIQVIFFLILFYVLCHENLFYKIFYSKEIKGIKGKDIPVPGHGGP